MLSRGSTKYNYFITTICKSVYLFIYLSIIIYYYLLLLLLFINQFVYLFINQLFHHTALSDYNSNHKSNCNNNVVHNYFVLLGDISLHTNSITSLLNSVVGVSSVGSRVARVIGFVGGVGDVGLKVFDKSQISRVIFLLILMSSESYMEYRKY